MKTSLTLFVFLLTIVFTPLAKAGLIINGGFEDNAVANGSWKWFTSSQVNGWNGSNIEIWNNLNNFKSYQGNQHAELNAHGSKGKFSIFQTFATSLGSQYNVSFAYAARKSLAEAFTFDILNQAGNVIFSQIMDKHTVKNWSLFNTKFSADSAFTTIRFTTLNSGTYGNFLDDVKVSRVISLGSVAGPIAKPNSVSEPSTLLVMLIAAAALLLSRR